MITTVPPDVAEGVRAAIATYAQALDDGRPDDIVETFCPDGSIDIPGAGVVVGLEALRATYGGWTPRRPQRHLVGNTLMSGPDADGIVSATSDLLFLVKADSGWRVQLVGRYHDTLRFADGAWRFQHRQTVFVE